MACTDDITSAIAVTLLVSVTEWHPLASRRMATNWNLYRNQIWTSTEIKYGRICPPYLNILGEGVKHHTGVPADISSQLHHTLWCLWYSFCKLCRGWLQSLVQDSFSLKLWELGWRNNGSSLGRNVHRTAVISCAAHFIQVKSSYIICHPWQASTHKNATRTKPALNNQSQKPFFTCGCGTHIYISNLSDLMQQESP